MFWKQFVFSLGLYLVSDTLTQKLLVLVLKISSRPFDSIKKLFNFLSRRTPHIHTHKFLVSFFDNFHFPTFVLLSLFTKASFCLLVCEE